MDNRYAIYEVLCLVRRTDRLTWVMDNIHTCLQLFVALQQLPLMIPVSLEFLYSAIPADRQASRVTSDLVRY